MILASYFRSLLKHFIAGLLLLSLSACISYQSEQTLYQDIGGRPALYKVFGLAIHRIYKDERINHYFKGVPKKHLRQHLTDQTCELIGGPCEYKGKTMLESHEGMNISQADFYILVEHVQQAMQDLGLTYAQQNLILKHLAPMQEEIIYH